jgi:hypothetical protein
VYKIQYTRLRAIPQNKTLGVCSTFKNKKVENRVKKEENGVKININDGGWD